MGKKRVFLIVLDSVGIGEMPDAADFNDEGSNTIYAASGYEKFYMPNMARLGFFDIDGVKIQEKNTWLELYEEKPGGDRAFSFEGDGVRIGRGAYARMTESSKGKDTTIGHWEIAGIVSRKPLPIFPEGFPKELLDEFSKKCDKRGVLCNKPYSGTEVIKDFGKQHLESGDLIVYTSADSVFQIAAHEDIVPIEKLYEYCETARELLKGDWGVGRVIARPFEGEWPFKRTVRRHDYSLVPPRATMLDCLKEAGRDVLAVGKINDIFAGSGITEMVRTSGNAEGIERTIEYTKKDFEGICFVNLVDFDMLYGHRNDIEGYGRALSYFDEKLPEIIGGLKEDDLLMITADHGCDPSTPSTDHSREYTPWVIAGKNVKCDVNLGTRSTFADIGATVLDYLGVENKTDGESLLGEIM